VATALRNTAQGWGWPAKLLHWVVAVLVVGMIALGVVMVDVVQNLDLQYRLFQLHKSVGLTVLALMLLRIGWRLANPTPAEPGTMRPWEVTAARLTHWAFYALLVAMPVTGFLTAASSPLGIPTVLFGVVPVPHPIGPDKEFSETLAFVHENLARVLLALLAVHVGAALRHHLLLRDEVLTRMLPESWRGRLDRWRWRRAGA
jgi:cytochrome b561